MKIAVVYESIYGNIAAVAETVAEGLRALGDVDVQAVSSADQRERQDADVLMALPIA